MTSSTMQKFQFRVSYNMSGRSHSIRIVGEAADDEEAIRAGSVLADLLEYQGAEHAAIQVIGSGERDVASFGVTDDVDSIDPPVRYGSGFRSHTAANNSRDKG